MFHHVSVGWRDGLPEIAGNYLHAVRQSQFLYSLFCAGDDLWQIKKDSFHIRIFLKDRSNYETMPACDIGKRANVAEVIHIKDGRDHRGAKTSHCIVELFCKLRIGEQYLKGRLLVDTFDRIGTIAKSRHHVRISFKMKPIAHPDGHVMQ